MTKIDFKTRIYVEHDKNMNKLALSGIKKTKMVNDALTLYFRTLPDLTEDMELTLETLEANEWLEIWWDMVSLYDAGDKILDEIAERAKDKKFPKLMVELGKWVADKAKGCFVRWRDRKGKALLEKIKRGELTGIELRQRRIEEEREQARKIERGEFDPNDPRVMMPLSMTKKDFELIIETFREHDDNNVEALKKICKIVKKKKKKKAKGQEVLA